MESPRTSPRTFKLPVIHAFLITIGIIAAIALAPVVFAVLRNPFFWIISSITGFTGIAVFVVWALATAPHYQFEPSVADPQDQLKIDATVREAQADTQRLNEAQAHPTPFSNKWGDIDFSKTELKTAAELKTDQNLRSSDLVK